MANIFSKHQHKAYHGATMAKVVDVIGAITNDAADEDLPGYNGAGDAYRDDLDNMWSFYADNYQKGKKTPLNQMMDYNRKADYEKIINEFYRDEVGASGHSSQIA